MDSTNEGSLLRLAELPRNGAGNHRIRVLTQLTDSGGEQAPLFEGIRELLPF